MEALLEEQLSRLTDRSDQGKPYVGRLAPSPTGALHLGNVRTFMIAWLRARTQGGRVILRTEDLDHPKDKPGAAAQAIEDLKWLGFDWDSEFVQSERKEIYRQARDILIERGLLYPCVCSRRDVENAQSAPHAGEQLHYPGTCRDRFTSWQNAVDFLNYAPRATNHEPRATNHEPRRTPCWRFRVPDIARVAFDDVFAGHFEQDVPRTLGDFPVSRDEGGAGYTLAVVVDDLLMGVTEVVRGDDLLPATPAQILIANALSAAGDSKYRPPQTTQTTQTSQTLRFCHVPLVVGPDGRRLAKRHGDTRVASYREAGVRPEALIGYLAASCGWVEKGEPIALTDLLSRFSLTTIPRTPFVVDDGAAELLRQ